MTLNACRKTNEYLFWRSHQKKAFTIFVGKILKAQVPEQVFGQVWGYSDETPCTPKNVLAPTFMA